LAESRRLTPAGNIEPIVAMSSRQDIMEISNCASSMTALTVVHAAEWDMTTEQEA
jgi:hypothetical protein